jgi:hypothetical protein
MLFLATASVALPSCLLVQPLDDTKDDGLGSGGTTSGSHAGATSPGGKNGGAGKSGIGGSGEGTAGSPPLPPAGGRGGSTAAGGSGPRPTGGAPSGVDFSYFIGTWTVTSGTITTDCGTGEYVDDATVGGKDTFEIGTTSDLILGKGTECPLLLDVHDLVAVAQDGQSCDVTTDTATGHYEFDSVSFIVSADHQTASSFVTTTGTVTSGGETFTCESNSQQYYKR